MFNSVSFYRFWHLNVLLYDLMRNRFPLELKGYIIYPILLKLKSSNEMETCICVCEFYNGLKKPGRFVRSNYIIEAFIIIMSIIYTLYYFRRDGTLIRADS